jgi:TRAP-type uncharacterized transport system fused permease subunit
MRIVISAPYYATVLLLITVTIQKSTRLSFNKWIDMIMGMGKTIAMIIAILMGVGLIIGSLMMTGVAFAFSHEIIKIASENVIILLILGALISFLLGMGLTISAVYVILAMTVAPPLVKLGLNPLAVHMFVIYYGMLSSITPPVALAAFGAASISGDSPMKTGFMAVRIGLVLFIVPFVFVLYPALIFQGPLIETAYLFFTFLIGIFFVVGGTEGFMHGLGDLGNRFFSLKRLLSFSIGILLIIPNTYSKILGVILAVFLVSLVFLNKKLEKPSANLT